MAKTAPMSFRLDPDLKEKLQRLADADRRSLTNYIEIVLEDHATRGDREREKQRRKALEELEREQLRLKAELFAHGELQNKDERK